MKTRTSEVVAIRGSDHSQRRTVPVELKLAEPDRKRLAAYLDHLGISVHTFVRRLVLTELLEERLNYPDTGTDAENHKP